jgi:hypothetical protein
MHVAALSRSVARYTTSRRWTARTPAAAGTSAHAATASRAAQRPTALLQAEITAKSAGGIHEPCR